MMLTLIRMPKNVKVSQFLSKIQYKVITEVTATQALRKKNESKEPF